MSEWQVCEYWLTEGVMGREPHHRDTTSLQGVSSEDKTVSRDRKQIYLVRLQQYVSLALMLTQRLLGSDGAVLASTFGVNFPSVSISNRPLSPKTFYHVSRKAQV